MRRFLVFLILIAALTTGQFFVRVVTGNPCAGPDPDDTSCNKDQPCPPCWGYIPIPNEPPPNTPPFGFMDKMGGTLVEVGDGTQRPDIETPVHCYDYGLCVEGEPIVGDACFPEPQGENPAGCHPVLFASVCIP